MQKFEYRTPRYLVDLPIVFANQSASISGRCREIGKEGMKVELEEPVSPGMCGTVSIRHKEIELELRVCVAHSGTGYDGLKFLFESDRDRGAMERLVGTLASPNGLPGPVLVR
jgi:hypothetical protein